VLGGAGVDGGVDRFQAARDLLAPAPRHAEVREGFPRVVPGEDDVILG
jgi:hypothetical protein